MCALALRTGIPPQAWEAAGGRYIATAFELLAEQDRRDRTDPDNPFGDLAKGG